MEYFKFFLPKGESVDNFHNIVCVAANSTEDGAELVMRLGTDATVYGKSASFNHSCGAVIETVTITVSKANRAV